MPHIMSHFQLINTILCISSNERLCKSGRGFDHTIVQRVNLKISAIFMSSTAVLEIMAIKAHRLPNDYEGKCSLIP
jgi:hypothetical protein